MELQQQMDLKICQQCETGLISDQMYPQSCMLGNYTGLSVILRGKFKGVNKKKSAEALNRIR